MHDDSVLVAIEAALHSPAWCACGDILTISVHDGAAWLECPAYAAPSRLPAMVSGFLRDLGHDRRRVVEVPGTWGEPSDKLRPTPAATSPMATRA